MKKHEHAITCSILKLINSYDIISNKWKKILTSSFKVTYIKPAVLDILDPQQFGAIPKSSSTQALISLLHKMYVSTDGNGAANRVVLLG